MATFLEQSKNCIYQADCREVLKQIPSEIVDLVIADPPYYRMKGAFDFVFQNQKEYLPDFETDRSFLLLGKLFDD